MLLGNGIKFRPSSRPKTKAMKMYEDTWLVNALCSDTGCVHLNINRELAHVFNDLRKNVKSIELLESTPDSWRVCIRRDVYDLARQYYKNRYADLTVGEYISKILG